MKRWKNDKKRRSAGVQLCVGRTFLMLIVLLIGLLWLLQIELLDDVYRYEKKRALQNVSESIVRNIDHAGLETLIRMSSAENNLCVLVVDARMKTLYSVDTPFGCIIHHLNHRDLRRMANKLGSEDASCVFFPMWRPFDRSLENQQFNGPVPLRVNAENGEYLISVQRARLRDGSECFVLLNTLVTPVTSVVNTIRMELWFVSFALLLSGMGLSFVLSRRISKPLILTTQAARALSRGEFSPVRSRQTYREIDELNVQLTQAARDLRKVEETQRELIANISHDLRTPLTLIEGYVEAMRDIPGENTPENLQVILDETRRLSSLVDAVLCYSKSQNAAPEENRRRFNLTESIREIILRYRKLTQLDGYQIRLEQDGEAWVEADPLKISQVVYNLINNALTYTGADKTVVIRQTLFSGKARISVIDSGEGIEAEELPYIWNRYYRGKKPHKRAPVGTGLGLSIARSILDGYGMNYGAESEPGKGSTFYFEMETTEAPVEKPD